MRLLTESEIAKQLLGRTATGLVRVRKALCQFTAITLTRGFEADQVNDTNPTIATNFVVHNLSSV